jgi:hypothetical protein
MPRHDNNDEPQRRRQQDGENRPQRPTQERPNIPGFNPQMPGDANLPAGPNDQPRRPERQQDQPNRAPELNRAAGDETRRAAGNAHIPDHMRDMLNRLNRLDRPGDISDEEARRLAGLDQDDAEPRPPELNIVPAVTRHEVARISQDIQAAGQVYPKWHGIKNLPGFQNRQIRGMGQDLFSMFTSTPHHDILTISTMANSEREVKAVLGWLKSNAEELPELDIDYSGYGMPGYTPEVREYKTENTRFHVVHDQAGWYIYAYPEGTAIDHSKSNALEYDGDDEYDEPTHDEYGAPIKRLKEETQMTFNSLSEQLRYLTSKLDNLQESEAQLDVQFILDEAIDYVLSEASTLSGLISKYPGGKEIASALHKRHELAAGHRTRGGEKVAPRVRFGAGSESVDPYYEELTDVKNVSQMIKASYDNYLILVGQRGCAAIKVNTKDFQARKQEFEKRRTNQGKEYNSATDTKLQWTVLWSTGAGVDEEVAKYRMGRTDRTGGEEGTTGTPNLLNVLGERIGFVGYPIKIFKAIQAADRGVKTARQAMKPQDAQGEISNGQIAKVIQPIIGNMVNRALGNIMNKASRLSQAGNFSQAQALAKSGERLQKLATAMDTSNPDFTYTDPDDYQYRYNRGPMEVYWKAVDRAVGTMTAGKSEEEAQQVKRALVNRGAQNVPIFSEFINLVKDNLLAAGTLE